MKRILLLFGASLGLVTAQAQWISPGAELGINFSNLHSRINNHDVSSDSRSGVKIGGLLDIGLGHRWSIQPGLYYSVKGAQQSYITSVENESGTITTHSTSDVLRLNYLEIPVNFQYSFPSRTYGHFFAGAGPYVAFCLSGKVTSDDITTVERPNGTVIITDNSSVYNLHVGNNANTDDVKGGDVGLNFNLGYQFAGGLFLRGNVGLGLMNIMPGGDADNYMRNNSLAFSIGYLFR